MRSYHMGEEINEGELARYGPCISPVEIVGPKRRIIACGYSNNDGDSEENGHG